MEQTSELGRMRNAAKAFHDDERGMETLQIVMIVGIAAIILIVLWQFFPKIREWVNGLFGKVTKQDPTSATTSGEKTDQTQ